jgi:CubicO group peptidase (beta-lactamase class C family)
VDHALDGDTVFEIGSIAKVFTALPLTEMVCRREVALDDPVSKYLPAESDNLLHALCRGTGHVPA